MKYWSKSALTIYRYLESMSNTIERIVNESGTNSNRKDMMTYRNTYSQTNKMIDLLERKRKIINLKLVVEESLNTLSVNQKRILTLSYIDGIKSHYIAELLGLSLRTFFRQKLKALEMFCEAMEELGYGLNFLKNNYTQEQWFSSVYNEVLVKNTQDECELDPSFIKNLLKNLGKTEESYCYI